jgi:hypothetical protein
MKLQRQDGGMSDVQRDHHFWYVKVEHHLGSFGVAEDIELSHSASIPDSYASPHEDYLCDSGNQLGVKRREQGDVGKWTRGDYMEFGIHLKTPFHRGLETINGT